MIDRGNIEPVAQLPPFRLVVSVSVNHRSPPFKLTTNVREKKRIHRGSALVRDRWKLDSISELVAARGRQVRREEETANSRARGVQLGVDAYSPLWNEIKLRLLRKTTVFIAVCYRLRGFRDEFRGLTSENWRKRAKFSMISVEWRFYTFYTRVKYILRPITWFLID